LENVNCQLLFNNNGNNNISKICVGYRNNRHLPHVANDNNNQDDHGVSIIVTITEITHQK